MKQIYGPLHFQMVEEEKILHYKKIFYSSSNEFLSFANLDSKTISKIIDTISIIFPETEYPRNSLNRYLSVLKYLMNSKENKDFHLYDEKIAFLIQAIDPELSIYWKLLTVGYSIQEEEKIKDEKADAIIRFIEQTVGAFDTQFLKYEEIYFQKVLKDGNIYSHIQQDSSKKFFDSLKLITSFDNVKDIEFQILHKKAEEYLTMCENPQSLPTLCFNMDNPNSVLELYTIYYKAIFSILVLDPELNGLRIYAEESSIESVRERMIKELGFYHENFGRLEELYRRRFLPDLKISEWTL